MRTSSPAGSVRFWKPHRTERAGVPRASCASPRRISRVPAVRRSAACWEGVSTDPAQGGYPPRHLPINSLAVSGPLVTWDEVAAQAGRRIRELRCALSGAEVPSSRAPAAAGVPAAYRGAGACAGRGRGHHREQSSVVRRSLRDAGDRAAPGDVSGQGGVLHRARSEGAADRGVLPGGPGRFRSTGPAAAPRGRRSPRGSPSCARAGFSASTRRAPARTTDGSTRGVPASPRWPSPRGCRWCRAR